MIWVNPFKYRPEHGGEDRDVEDMDWEDNWVSNLMAWVSQHWPFEPMCNMPDRLSSRIAGYFYTDCPCCLYWLGFVIGILTIIVVGTINFLLTSTVAHVI